MSDKITNDDIFDSDFLEKGYQAVEKLTQGFKDMATQIGNVAIEQKEFLSGFKINNSGDIKKLNDELAKANKTITELNNANKAAAQGELELAKIRQANAKAIQEEEKAAQQKLRTEKLANAESKKTITLYQEQSKILRDLKNDYKNVALAQGQSSKAAQDLLAKITPLDAKLKALDKTTGDNFRNVGNYSSALQGVGGAINNILGAAGISVSIGGVVGLGKAILETRAEFQKFEAVLTNTLGSKSQAEAALTRIQEFAAKTPFGVKELTEDFVKLANTGFKPTIKQMTALGDLASSQGKSFDQLTEALIDAQTGEFERLKEFGIRAKKEGDKVTLSFKDQKIAVDNNNESIRAAILGFGELEGVAGGMAAISETLGGKISNLNDNWDALLNNFGEQSEGAFAVVIDLFNDLLGAANEAQTAINSVNKTLKQQGVEQSFFEKLSGSVAGTGLVMKQYVDQAKKAADETNNYAASIRVLQRGQLILSTALKTGVIDARTYEIQNAILTDGINDLTEGSEAYTKELNKQNEKTKESTKNLNANTKAVNKNKDAKSTGTFEEAQKKAQEELDEQQRLLDFEYEQDKKERDQKQRDEDFAAAQKEADRLLELEEKQLSEEEKIRKEAKEKEIKDLFDVASKALQIAEKEINEKEKLRQEALDKEIKDREENIDIQRKRAEQGLSNTLAFEEKALKDAEARKEEENKKALKREKALTFFKLLSANAEKEPNSALQKTITEMLLGEAIAGAFFKGTEKVEDDLKGNKVHNGRDGYVVAVDGSERVLTGEQNKLIGNMSNEDLAKLAHDYNNNKLLPNYMLNEGVNTSVSENIYASMQLSQMVKMNERLESVEEAIKNKPVSNTSFDNLGHIIREEIRNGLKTITKTPLTKGYGN
jgi:hypothetical protein